MYVFVCRVLVCVFCLHVTFCAFVFVCVSCFVCVCFCVGVRCNITVIQTLFLITGWGVTVW